MSPARFLGVGFAFLGIAGLVYVPALDGRFVSDDSHYLSDNPLVQNPTPENLRAILSPRGVVPAMVKNYAPAHLLAHSVAWQAFGADVRGHHAVNVALHALASLLLVLLYARCGIPTALAIAGGAVCLVHPANVEAVAWVSQLKSPLSLVFAVGSLLALPRRPVISTVLFGIGLLAKPTAAVALPAALAFAWLGGRTGPHRDPHALAGAIARQPRALLAWGGVLCAFAWAQFGALGTDALAPPVTDDAALRFATSLVLGLRYAVLACTGIGLSTFHEPAPVGSASDPWLWAALLLWGLLGWRAVWALRRGRVEAVWWIWVLASFLPISQVVPFRYPLADRYLYFILPGLLGGVLSALSLAPREAGRPPSRFGVRAAAVGLSAMGVLFFALRAHDRAAVWQSPHRVVADAAVHYPDGTHALLLRAQAAASSRDVETTVAALRRLMEEKRWNRFFLLLADPRFRKVGDDPRFRAVVADMAQSWIDHLTRSRSLDALDVLELRIIGSAHAARGEFDRAEAALERALAKPSAFAEAIRRDLEAVRARRSAAP